MPVIRPTGFSPTVIRHAESRRTQTPNALMTTLASPAQGGSAQVVWRVDMQPGQVGPRHGIDTEQVWTVLEGGASIDIGGLPLSIGPGDTVVIPADVPRQIRADAMTGFAAIVVAPAGTRAYRVGDASDAAEHAVPDSDKLVPAWVV
jgi:quercetin dioxygenase-like cupin family protein